MHPFDHPRATQPARPATQAEHRPEWTRFSITFTDGGTLRLFDKRRLGRVRPTRVLWINAAAEQGGDPQVG